MKRRGQRTPEKKVPAAGVPAERIRKAVKTNEVWQADTDRMAALGQETTA